MKYDVTYSCGHEGKVELFGKTTDRMKKIEWLETTLCPECYAREQAQKANKGNRIEEVEMHYSEYKNNYSNCQTLPNSYNRQTKTIIVLVPVEDEEAEEVEETKEVGEVEEATLTIEEIAKKANSTVARTKEMIAKTNEELDALIADLEKRFSALENPTRSQIEMLNGAKMAVSLVKQYKAQTQNKQ